MKVLITPPGCTWPIEFDAEGGRLAIIRVAHQQLVQYRGDGRRASPELLEDIAALELILNSPDAEARADAYIEYKKARVPARIPAREVARALGWLPTRGGQ